jgi:hypothetical protein
MCEEYKPGFNGTMAGKQKQASPDQMGDQAAVKTGTRSL